MAVVQRLRWFHFGSALASLGMPVTVIRLGRFRGSIRCGRGATQQGQRTRL